MTPDIDLWPEIQPHWWKWTRRSGHPANVIQGIIWHATRSGLAYGSLTAPYGAPWTVGWELTATLNWFRSRNNGNEGNAIAGMSNYVIGDGKLVRCMADEMVPRYSAGVHDFHGISVEVCQPLNNEPYDPRDIALCRELAAELSGQYGFPLGRVPFVDGYNTGWPGEVGHEDTAQGRAQGKSDPGALFWLAYQEETDMTPAEAEAIARKVFDEATPVYFRDLMKKYFVADLPDGFTDPADPDVLDAIRTAVVAEHQHDPGGVIR
ncbi:MAG: N-acetylmuramoyl-L-alanine amidase [Gemmatimonadaceae bacterium]|nr:N-acetylmuramoyl-L-alanine amidase [Gemmatimonadaceae bacterium]